MDDKERSVIPDAARGLQAYFRCTGISACMGLSRITRGVTEILVTSPARDHRAFINGARQCWCRSP